MRDILKKFLEYLEHQKNYSENTLKAYDTDITQFIRFLRKKRKKMFKEVEYKDFIGFLSYLKAEDRYTEKSISRKVASIKAFFKFLAKRKLISVNPALLLYTPKVPEKLPSFLSEEEVIKIIQAPSGNSWQMLRDKAIIELLYSTGIRVGELTSLAIKDINFLEETVKITGKGEEGEGRPCGNACYKGADRVS